MNKFFCGALVLSAGLVAPLATAQVVTYGLLDSGVEYVTNINAGGASVVKMPSLTGSFPSRLGFKGTEELGGDMKAVFVLEMGFGVDTGLQGQGGRLFGRQAYVGLKNSHGTLMLGRQVNMTFMSMLRADVMGPNIHGVTNMDGYLPNARSDNAIGYLGKFDDLTVGATWSLGRDVAASGGPGATNCAGESAVDRKACRQLTALVAYDSKGFGVAAAYDTLNGGPGAAAGLTASNYHVDRVILNGYVLFGDVKLGLGAIDRQTHAAADASATTYFLGLSYPFAASLVLDTQLSRLDIRHSADASTLFAARATYFISKRTAAYLSAGHIRNAGAAAVAVSAGDTVGVGLTQNGVMAGMRHSF
jgi:predicted porin